MLRCRGNRPEEAVLLIVRTGGEIEGVRAGCAPAAQGQLPQPVDLQRLAVGAVEFIDKLTARVEHVDLAVPEIADEDLAAEPAEGKGGTRHAPRRIEWPAAGEAPQQVAVGIEDVDKTMAGTLNVVMLFRVLQRVSDEEIAVDTLNAERRIAGRYIRIDESPIGCREGKLAVGAVGAEHIDRPGIKVGRKEEKAVDVDAVSKALIDSAACGIVEGDYRIVWIRSEPPGPGGKRPVLGSENKRGLYTVGRIRRFRARNDERRGGVPDDAGWRRVYRRVVRIDGFARGRGHDVVGQRDRHLECHLRAVTGIKRRTAGCVVSNPERTAGGRKRDTPRILQHWVLEIGFARQIGDEPRHDISILLILEALVGADGGGSGDRNDDNGKRGEMQTEFVHHACPSGWLGFQLE